MTVNHNLLTHLLSQAAENPRLRQNLDLRTGADDNSQRMLNALMPGSEVPVHRHPHSNETVICLEGKLAEILYEEDPAGHLTESMRYELDPSSGNYGCVVPAGVWHTVEVLAPSVIFEAKDGKCGDGLIDV